MRRQPGARSAVYQGGAGTVEAVPNEARRRPLDRSRIRPRGGFPRTRGRRRFGNNV